MKIQVLWVPPAERRFGSGDIMTDAQLRELGVDPQALLDAGEAQILEDDPKGRAVKAAPEKRKK
jgi:hypothetical protein